MTFGERLCAQSSISIFAQKSKCKDSTYNLSKMQINFKKSFSQQSCPEEFFKKAFIVHTIFHP